MIKKLIEVQQELKAPKGQYNSFGKYNYRSCEDILTAVKPLLADRGLLLSLSDEVLQIGSRFYVKATATVSDGNAEHVITAYAREAENKKGMDDSQITGKASSYARKYALNGLFCIDDTKDADTDEYAKKTGASEKITTDQLKEAIEKAGKTVDEVIKIYNKKHNKSISDLKFMKQEDKQKAFKYYGGQ